MGIQDREHLEIQSARTLNAWLAKNHSKSLGLWVVTYKKASGVPAPTYDEIVKVALSYGASSIFPRGKRGAVGLPQIKNASTSLWIQEK